MDYPHSREPFSEELFKHPPKEYRGAPFWAWNCRIDPQEIPSCIETFHQMGFGGFHIHSRIGLDTEYLGKEFLDDVALSIEEGKKRDMLTYLYDEDKWPSGYGAGRVTCHAKWRTRFLLFSRHPYADGFYRKGKGNDGTVNRNGRVRLVACYQIHQDKDGRILDYQRLPIPCGKEAHCWYLYEGVTDPLPWFNNQGYVDTLSREAILAFLKVTHEVYAGRFQKEFGKQVPSIFTDEPQFYPISNLADSFHGEAAVPFTPLLPQAFEQESGRDLFEVIPEAFLETKQSSDVRYLLLKTIAHLFCEHYAGTLGAWCDRHGLLLTGHLMQEPTLDSQTRSVGETMASYRYFGIPGIDMLANRYEYTTAKQVESAVHQWDKKGAASEMYGVTNWDFDFRGHLAQGNWQAALGITLRVPHLAWMGMAGEAKRDYPAPIDSHSPWWREYRQIEDHFARVHLAMTRGRAVETIALLHPVESYWQMLGPDDLTGLKRKQLDEEFTALTEALLDSCLDFDYLGESTLPDLYRQSDDALLHVGAMAYQVVVVPPLCTIRKTSLETLHAFACKGGRVIFLGGLPQAVDGKRRELAPSLFPHCRTVYTLDALQKELEPFRQVQVSKADGSRMEGMLYQLRKEEDGQCWLFLCHGKKKPQEVPSRPNENPQERIEVGLKGRYAVAWYDTMHAQSHAIPSTFDGSYTKAWVICHPHDSVLLRFTKEAIGKEYGFPTPQWAFDRYLPANLPVTLSEPNSLVLDMACWNLEGGAWQAKEEILRIDNAVRSLLGYAHRDANLPQPWLVKGNPDSPKQLTLSYQVESELEVPVDLAFEGAPLLVTLNGKAVPLAFDGWFVDRAIRRCHLEVLHKGTNEICMCYGFTRKTNLENVFLLGDFGVAVSGDRCRIVSLPKEIGFGSYAVQGLPFYGGNVTYHAEIETDGRREYAVKVPRYQAPLVAVFLDHRRLGSIIGEPYQLDLGRPEKGVHALDLVSYGSRINQFGQLHNMVQQMYWGPRSWRMTGPYWSYTYRLRECGILSQPLVLVEKE